MIQASNATIRQEARTLLDGRWSGSVAVSLCLLCANFAAAGIVSLFGISRKAFVMSILVGFVLSLLVRLLEDGGFLYFLHLKRKEPAQLKDLIWPYRNEPDCFLIIGLIRGGVLAALALPMIIALLFTDGTSFFFWIFVLIWGVVELVLSVWFCLIYAMAELVLLDPRRTGDQAPSGALDAMRTSRHLMRGNRLRLLRLFLSFIGYGFLCLFTAGIGTVWVLPYLMTSVVMFYDSLAEQ